MKKIFPFILLLSCLFADAQVQVAHVFTDSMVLQRNAPIPVWGWAKKAEKISVSFHDQKRSAVTDKAGKWIVYFDKEAAGGPYTLMVKGKSSADTLKDILVGDVWICSGQSNMEWPLSATENAETTITSSFNNNIRHIKVQHEISVAPLADIKKTAWQVCTPASAPEFTAAGYYFAQSLQKELNVPIGLINTSWGGTIVETWISKSGLQTNNEFASIANQLPSGSGQFEKDQIERIQLSVAAFQYIDKNEITNGWEQPGYDDSRWSNLVVPKPWEEQGLNSLDGTVWYRTTIELTEEQAGKDAILYLGKIDDCDTTYINGEKIGETCVWDQDRKYTISGRLLKPGKNVIVVKVLDTGGAGGFYGDEENVKLETAAGTISLAGEWKVRVDIKASIISVNPNSMPTLLYNAMINPLLPFAFKGVIWYQGESNADWAEQYRVSFPLLITDWRNKFQQGDFPFYFVQLASFNANNENGTTGSRWAELRESQFKTLQVSNTGMIVTYDISNGKDLHPLNKKDVGKRLALLALKNDYGKNIVASGPVYKNMQIESGQIKLEFENANDGLFAKDNKYGYLQGFMIAGKDQQFKWAKGSVRGNSVIVWNDEVPDPVAVRYAWTDDNTEANLVNKQGLPAVPFRTDDWKLLTDGIKYIIGK